MRGSQSAGYAQVYPAGTDDRRRPQILHEGDQTAPGETFI